MASIFAARSGARVVLLDGAKKIGAKILISGGGRCNVTHYAVSAHDVNGNRNAIGKVLRTFDVAQTIAFFESIGVRLKREETGKLFPTTDRARTVLNALLSAAKDVDIRTDHRVLGIERGFAIETSRGVIESPRVILATGGGGRPRNGEE